VVHQIDLQQRATSTDGPNHRVRKVRPEWPGGYVASISNSGSLRGALSTARIAAASSSCRLAGNGPERCQPWSWKSFLPRGRRSGMRCSRSGAELAAAPSVAGSSGPRRAARRRMPARPLPISSRREWRSRCGTRSPAMWRTGPRRSAVSREPLAAPAAAPVATWRATITVPN
jgi:hypothetical protein